MLKQLEKYFDLLAFKEESRRLGVNFITAGVVGVFVNHFAGTSFSIMFWTSLWICFIGTLCLLLGLKKRKTQ